MLGTRIVTAIALLALIGSTLTWLPRWTFFGLTGVVVLLALAEWGRLTLGETRSYRRVLLGCGTLCAAVQLYWIDLPVLPILLAASFLLAAVYLYLSPTLERYPQRWALATTGVAYLACTIPFWARLAALPQGPRWILLLVAMVALCDTGAYTAGRLWGRHKMAPLTSPNKTWEGFAGGVVSCVCIALLIRFLALPSVPLVPLLGCALVIALVAPIGDLIESALKRAVHAKDSGALLPGHGGILDRIDAYIFTAPIVYYFALWIQQ